MSRIGFDHLKILIWFAGFTSFSAAVVVFVGMLFSILQLPVAGVVASVTLCSFLASYFWTAFSGALAIARFRMEARQT